MITPEDAVTLDNVASIHCYETKEAATAIRNEWDICKFLHPDETVEEFHGVSGISVENDQINRMISDDDLLYVRFIKPASIIIFKGDG